MSKLSMNSTYCSNFFFAYTVQVIMDGRIRNRYLAAVVVEMQRENRMEIVFVSEMPKKVLVQPLWWQREVAPTKEYVHGCHYCR
jgi:hypothetical protein